MSQVSRRQLLKTTLVAAGGVATSLAFPACRAFGRVLGANDTINVAVIGLNGRGRAHIDSVLQPQSGYRLVALCDVDPAVLSRAVKSAGEKGAEGVETFADARKLFDSKGIDAITIATPNHWHSLLGIWACQAGKHVFVEKPVSHCVWEGRQFVNAARKYKRMVQTGTQSRANPDVIAAVEWLRAGNLGKVRYIQTFCYKPRLPIGKVGHGEIPKGLDYDLWCGPRPVKPLTRRTLHYDWHWFYDYGSGELGNTAVHEADQARLLLGFESLPKHVMSIGGRLGYDDDGQTPSTQLIYHEYDGVPIICEIRGLPKGKEYQSRQAWTRNLDWPPGFINKKYGVGLIVTCEGGRLVLEEGGLFIRALDKDGKVIKEFQNNINGAPGWGKGVRFIFASWANAIRSGQETDLAADILEGHISSALCHMGVISHRIGRTRPTGEIREEIKANALAADRFESMREHLERNGVDLAKTELSLGPWLTVDPAAERFVDNDSANALLRDEYRDPYVVPENV